jgi:hypothetical protein
MLSPSLLHEESTSPTSVGARSQLFAFAAQTQILEKKINGQIYNSVLNARLPVKTLTIGQIAN